MRPRGAACLALLTLAACGAEARPVDVPAVRIAAGVHEVALGETFAVTVTRSWPADLVAESWDDETLAPLLVHALDVDRRESAGVVVETRRFRALAVTPGDVRVLPPLFVATARGGGDEVVVTGDALDVRVRAAPVIGDDADVELPGGLLPRSRSFGVWLAMALAAGLAALLVTHSRRLRRARVPLAAAAVAAASPPPPEPPAEVALRALGAAEEHVAGDDPRPLHDAISNALREYVRAQFALGAPEWTSDELLAAASRHGAGLAPGLAPGLRDVLAQCVLVRFARVRPDAAARERTLEAARELVRATADEGPR